MLNITLGPATPLDPTTDPLGRRRAGYAEDMTQQELYDAARWCWVLGARADRERYALICHQGTVKQVIRIDRLVDATPGRRAIEGQIAGPGDPVAFQYLDQPTPAKKAQNPIQYIDGSQWDLRECGCGCGASVFQSSFLPGHDQIALHQRVAQVGTVAKFLEWFDQAWGSDRRTN